MCSRKTTRGRRLPPLAGFALLCGALHGCDRDAPDAAAKPEKTRVVTTGPPGTGILRGAVSFKGAPPEGEDVEGARCHSGAAPIHVAPVTVGPGGALKDVMVYVKDPPAVPAGGSENPVVLDQVHCRYVPGVVGVRVGQVLRVTSSDPAMHNVHTLSGRNPRLNFGMTGAGQSRDVKFDRTEQFTVRCDVHPWMNATVYVLDHPFFAVTGDDGRFEITGLPPGGHEVVFSHPFLGERVRKIDVADAAASVDVTFERGQ